MLKDEPQKYDDAWLSLIDDDDDCSLMLVSLKIIDGIGVCMMFEIVSELWLLETIDAWCRGDIGGSDLNLREEKESFSFKWAFSQK